MEDRLKKLEKIFETVDESKRDVISPLLPEVVYLESRLSELRELPQIRVHPRDKSRQEVTAAGKQYKETMQAYLNALKVLMTALYRTEANGADELMEKLKEFEL